MKKITYCMALLLLTVLQTFGQVFIGNGNNTEQYIPFNPYYGYSYSQSIYTAAEINATGSITSLAWYYTGEATSLPHSQNLKISLGHTSKLFFESDTDWQAATDMTEVYSGGISVNGAGWVTIQFTTPFLYNGTDNLVITTAELQPGYDGTNQDRFATADVVKNRSLVYTNDGTPADPANPPTANLIHFVPNIILGEIAPSCLVPQFLAAHEITDTTALLTWATLGAPPTGGTQYYVSTSSATPIVGTEATGAVIQGEPISGLLSNTNYNVWLRNVCDGTPGAWSFSASFKTACSATGEFSADFDTAPTGTLPDCWSSIIRGDDISQWTTVNAANTQSHSGQNSIKFDNQSATNVSDVILVSPKLNSLAGGTHRLKFYAKGNIANALQVGTLDTNNSTAVFSNAVAVEISTDYTEYVVSFPDYTGTDSYIGIRSNSETANTTIYLDDIRWEVIPACADVSSVTVSPITTNTATVSWEANSTTQWEVVYSETATTPADLVPIAATENNTELTGLTSNTSYKVWVRSVCGVNPGAWIGPVLFTTNCDPIATFSEGFDSVTAPNLPGCWSSILRGETLNSSAIVASTPFYGNTSAYSVYLTGWNTVPTTNDVILVSPNLLGLAEHTNRVKFFAKGPGTLEVGTLDSNTIDAAFNLRETINIPTNTVGTGYTEYTVDFKNYVGTDTYIGFRVVQTIQNGTIRLDDIRWELSPECSDVTGITVPSYTPDSATVTWDANSDSQWDVAYGTSDVTDPSLATSIPVSNDPTTTIEGLTDNTNYKVWVRTVCDNDTYGVWIGPITFKTDCIAVTEFSENFDGVTVPQLPDCWKTIKRGPFVSNDVEAFVKNSTSKSHSGTNAIAYHSDVSLDNAADKYLILVSPQVSNLANGTHRLRFYASGYYNTVLQVGTLDNNTPSAVFTPIGEPTSITDSYAEYVIDFSIVDGNSTDKYIGIRYAPPVIQGNLFIDDVVWEEAPSCPDVTAISISEIGTTDALVNWTAGATETNWDIAYAESTVTDPSLGTIGSSADSANHQLSELTPATKYNVWVRSSCNGDVKGNWIGPVEFITDCTPATTFNEGFESTALLTVPTCWSTIKRGAGLSSSAYTITSSSDPYAGAQTFYLYAALSNPATSDIILISPHLENLNQHTNSLSFYLKGNANIVIGTLNDNTPDAVFTPYNTTITGTSEYVKYTVNFADYSGDDQYIGFRHNSANSALVGIDNVVWDLTSNLSNGEFDNADFTVYPNPVKDVLNLSYKQAISNVSIYNVLGQKVIDKTVNTNTAAVNMASLSSGTYIVKVMADNQIKTLKVVKE